MSGNKQYSKMEFARKLNIVIKPITKNMARDMICKYHYSKVLPKINKHFLGGYINDKLIAVVTLGWGVRPLHTIRKLFPSLVSKNYLEIGKLCVVDEMKKNTGSQFISAMLRWARQYTEIDLIFTWADGMLAKAGYIYQSANFLYGGYIWTDTYFTEKGEKIHPRLAVSRFGGRVNAVRQFPDWKHYKGKQFRYLYFLCNKRRKRRLLKESTVQWDRTYPKGSELEWKIRKSGKYENTSKPYYNPNSLEIRSPTPLFDI